MLTLGDLLDHAEFELELLTGTAQARNRPILGAHNSEMAHPTEFIPPDWILLTLGLRLQNQPDAQRELIRELDAGGICALGFGVDVTFSQPPESLLDEAARRGFPVFRVPYETPYREILGFVNKALISADFSSLQQAFSMQNYLLESFKAESPVRDLGQRLAHLLQGEVYLFDSSGRVRIGAADERGAQVWNRIMRQRDGTTAVAPAEELLAMPLTDRAGQEQGWLAVLGSRRSVPAELVQAVMRSAERFLDFIDLQREAARAEDRLIREEVLKAALGPLTTYDERELLGRFRRFGIDLTAPARVAICRIAGRAGATSNKRRRLVEDALGASGMPYLTMADSDDLVILVQAGTDELQAWAAELGSGVELVVGAGREITRVRDVPKSLHGARTALRGLNGRLRLVDTLGLAPWLVHTAPETELAARVEEVLGTLLNRPDLMHTLKVYFAHDLNVAAAAVELFIHPNTLRYRLGQIEAVTGRSLSSLPALVDTYLAYLACEEFDMGDTGEDT